MRHESLVRAVVATTALLGAILSSSPVAAQADGPPEGRSKLVGAAVPQNLLAKNFFRYLQDYKDWGEEEWHHLIHHVLGLEPDSLCAQTVEIAMQTAAEGDRPRPEPPLTLAREQYERQQLAAARAHARWLGRIYWKMRKELERNDCSTEKLDVFLEGTVRGSIQVSRGGHSDKPFLAEIVEADFLAARDEIE